MAANATTACTLGTSSSGCSGLATGDCGTFLKFTSSSAMTVTPPNSLPVGCQVAIEQEGTGTVSLAAGTGATLNKPHSFAGSAYGQYSTVGLTVTANSGGSSAVAVMTGDGK